MAVPPRKIRQLPPALPPKDSDVFAISQMGDDGVPTTRAMQRAQFQQDIIEVINAARQQFVDTANAEHKEIRDRLSTVEQDLAQNTLTDEQLQAALVMLQQMVNGESGKTPYDLWLENGHTGTMQDYLNSLVGPRGPQGEKGDSIKGDRGERGEPGVAGVGIQGPSGNPGTDGKDGKDGAAATIAVGSVTSGAAPAVTNSGTPNAAVLDFVLQTGPAGKDGKDSTVAGPQGSPGKDGAAATVRVGTVTTGAAGSTATVTNSGTTAAAVLDFTIPQGATGAAGSNATATPLATTAPAALASTAAVGTSTSAARADHVHPLPAGRLVFVGNATISKTLLVALGSGMTREDVTLTGITTADQGKLVFSTITPCSAGCEAINVYAKAANTLTIVYNSPGLAIGAVINIPLAIWRIV